MHGRFNATANYVLYRAVLDRLLRERLDPDAMTDAMRRGRARDAAEALAEYGIVRPGSRAADDRTASRRTQPIN